MTCLPYKDSTIITAQALSILGFFLSLVSFGFIPGLVSFMMLQVVWCCAMNKCGLITAGVFAVITSIADIICGILLLTSASASQYTIIYSSSSSPSDGCTYVVNGVTYDCSGSTGFNSGSTTITTNTGPFVGVAIVSFIAAVCWIATAFCIFIFVRSGRYERCIEKSLRENDDDIVFPSTTVKPTNTVEVPPSDERDETTKVEYVEDLDVESH
mmetsp:Transcript_44307/g.107088  ORF Transcript_44307/g.107088 Transcript_44307/m.107088 type:complete len:213 (-) Transcript_44307:697-1335(-)